MFEPRPKEQDYAWLPKAEHPPENRYGKTIETVPEGNALRGESLNINGDSTISDNPDRYKQHGFYFNADNCISCHACEAACSEKNDLPAHIAFRSVGYVEGGSWPAYQRMNISMACNHCDDPVCLKGCPTRAYTKFAEYGAVLQDPDICFGCGYCTWVCPYNAPQLDPIAGHVSKCNMCVDRLEVGLKPACSSACLAGALDFGIIETTPENREQLETTIPGFPSTDITHPNIRFQQTKSMPRNMTRPDSMPLRYENDSQNTGNSHHGEYQAKVDEDGRAKVWGWKQLRTREDPLVIFTLVTQAVVGAMLALFLAPKFGLDVLNTQQSPIALPVLLLAMIAIQTLGLVLSTLHLGKPHRFYRAFYNLRHSPVSREVAGVAVFYNMLGGYTLFAGLPHLWGWLPQGWLHNLVQLSGWAAIVSGIAALYFMHRIYRIPARPYWDHWQVLSSFFGNMLSLGGLVVGIVSAIIWTSQSKPLTELNWLAWPILIGLALETIGLWAHVRYLNARGGEAAAAHYAQTHNFAYSYQSRNLLLALGLISSISIGLLQPSGGSALIGWLILALTVLGSSLIGRALFYALVVPTTMPGAFFWRNKGFEEHARETGLADMPQTGVVPDLH